MKRFFKLCAISMQSNLYYRASFFASLVSPLILLLGQTLLWTALFEVNNGRPIGEFEKPAMYTYILLTFLINNLLTWRSENQLSRKITSGSIVSECVRPVPFLSQNIADMSGTMLLQAGVNFLFVIALFVIFAGQLVIAPIVPTLLALLSLVLATVLRMLLVSTFSLLCFYTTRHLGITWTRTSITEFFSGAVIPVALFPGALKAFAYATPFPLMLQAPISIYLQQETYYSLPVTFALQIAWIVAFYLIQTFMWRSIRKNIIVAGG